MILNETLVVVGESHYVGKLQIDIMLIWSVHKKINLTISLRIGLIIK